MEHKGNIVNEAATNEPACPPTRRIHRHDGWTPERMRAFFYALAGGASVAEAARVVGMSRQSAYAFRRSANGRAFDIAWRAAQELALKRSYDAVMAKIEAKRLRRLRSLAPRSRLVQLSGRELQEWGGERKSG